jgi:DNA recombination-dependent growth factor C
MRRYKIEEPLPENFLETIKENIIRHGFNEIDEGNLKESSMGWTPLDNPYGGTFEDENYYRNGYITMSLRIDKKTVPAKTLKSYILKEERKRLEESNRERLSYSEKKNVKEAVATKLLKQAIPTSNVYDFVWALEKRYLFFFATSDSLNDKFIELFMQTFQVTPIKMSLYGIVLDKGVAEEALFNLQESFFG